MGCQKIKTSALQPVHGDNRCMVNTEWRSVFDPVILK